jgi:hypothetical protein
MHLSRGGFSFYFPREGYQEAAVSTFLANIGNKYISYYKCVRCCDLS